MTPRLFAISLVAALSLACGCHARCFGAGTGIIPTDTLNRDSDERNRRLYDSIRSKASRRRISRLLYDALFIPPADSTGIRAVDESGQLCRYDGRTIADIRIEREDVFRRNGSWIERAGNAVHTITAEHVIRRDLLLHTGGPFEAAALVRTKQLLQSRPYISEVSADVTPDPSDSTMVVVTIRTRDSWTIGVDAGMRSRGHTTLGLYDANILGTGTLLRLNTNIYRTSLGYGGNLVEYEMPNILGSFFKAKLSAGRAFGESELRFDAHRDFIKPTDYGAGLSYADAKSEFRMIDGDTIATARFHNLDIWGGRSVFIPRIASSIYLTARYGYITFDSRPPVAADLNPAFHQYDLLLFGAGLYRENFYTSSYIDGFGISEYLATGYKAELVAGMRWGEFSSDIYIGINLKSGAFTRRGFFAGSLSLGGFTDIRTGRRHQCTADIGLSWFSNLYNVRRNRIRQYLSLHYTAGWNRGRGNRESITFTATDGLRMLSSHGIYGTDRLVVNAETVVFTPYRPLGFRVAVTAFTDIGLIGYSHNVFRNRFCNSLGFGLRLRNERLVFSTLNLRFGLAWGRNGLLDSRYVDARNISPVTATRYMPSRPEIVGYE